MCKRIAYLFYATFFSAMGVAACAPLEPVKYAEVCDDTKEPNCAPDRKVIVE